MFALTPPPATNKVIFGNPNAICDAIRRPGHWGWLGHKGGTFMNGNDDLIKGPRELP